MLTWMRRFFTPPVFDDLEKTRAAQLLHSMLLAVLAMTVLAAVVLLALEAESFFSDWTSPATILTIIAAVLVLHTLMRRGHVQFASALLSLALSAIIILATYNYGGVSNSAMAAYLLCIIIAGLLLGAWGAIAFTAVSVVSTAGLWYAGRVGMLPPYSGDSSKMFTAVSYSAIFVIGGLLLRYATNSIAEAIGQARRNERAQAEANRELQKLQISLEQQVADRTRSLERRTIQLQTAAEVGRTVTAVLEVEQLTQQVVELVRRRFSLDYVGLFLVDEAGEWAVLQAAEGRTAENVLRGYRVPVNGDSIISQSIAQAQTRMATGAQELPGARSVAVLPLHSRDRVFGAITLASDQPDAFDQDTVAVLGTMADQVAVALDNAQLFAQSRAALETARRAYGELSHQAWAELLHARLDLSMRKSQSGTFVVPGAPAPHAQAALRTGQVVVEQEDKRNLATPIRVREQVIGVIDAHKPDGSTEWTAEEIKLLETLAEQLGVALDSARLYQDTQRRAAREQLTREITDKMRRAVDMDELLQTTLKEMTAALGAPGAFVQLIPPSESASGQEQAGARVREA